MKTLNIHLIILVLKSYIIILFNWLLIWILKNISEKLLIFTSNNIKYNTIYDISDSTDDEIIEPIDIPSDYKNILEKFNINNVINKYMNSTNKNKKYDENSFYIINSFLFNFKDNQVISKYICTKKIIILFNNFGSLNTIKIKEFESEYKYLYIFYKNELNNFCVKIVDIHNNIDIICHSKLLFNVINL